MLNDRADQLLKHTETIGNDIVAIVNLLAHGHIKE